MRLVLFSDDTVALYAMQLERQWLSTMTCLFIWINDVFSIYYYFFNNNNNNLIIINGKTSLIQATV